MTDKEKARREAQSQSAKAAQAPKPKTVKLLLKPAQVKGVLERQVAANNAKLQYEIAQNTLNTFLSGIVSGHGYDVVEVTALDDKTRELTIVVPPKAA